VPDDGEELTVGHGAEGAPKPRERERDGPDLHDAASRRQAYLGLILHPRGTQCLYPLDDILGEARELARASREGAVRVEV
jgi:hypothetical protein